MDKKCIHLSTPTIHGEELQFVKEAFKTEWISSLGPNVSAFEEEISNYLTDTSETFEGQSLYAAALCSGTAAIHLALINAGISAGDIVFCSDLTFAASCNPICYQGAKPVFIDSEMDTWNMDPVALKKAFKQYPEVKAVIVVNLYGTPAKLQEIKNICKEYEVSLIEDAAESLGASLQGQQTGTFGDQAAISFNGNKIITSSGGGMLLSIKKENATRARFLSTQAREPKRYYEHKEIGFNYRMSNIAAGIGRGQLIHLSEHIKKKKEIYMQYLYAFQDSTQISMNPVPIWCEPNYWLSCIKLNRECRINPYDIMLALDAENIESRPIWKPMHMQPVFSNYEFVTLRPEEPISEEIFNYGLCLPSDIKNSSDDIEKIIQIIRNLLK